MLGFWTSGPIDLYIIAFFSAAIVIPIVILRWVLRINKALEIMTDQASFLEDIKDKLDEIKNTEYLLKKITHNQEKLLEKPPIVIKQIKKTDQ